MKLSDETINNSIFFNYKPIDEKEIKDKTTIITLLNTFIESINEFNFEIKEVDVVEIDDIKWGCCLILIINNYYYYIDIFNDFSFSICKSEKGEDLDDDALIYTSLTNAINYFKYHN